MTRGRDVPKARIGVEGLDDILGGGLSRGRVFLLEGNPGTGKTTIAVQFLVEGARLGEPGLYITLSETKQELLEGAATHGLDLGQGNEIFELVPSEKLLDPAQHQTLLYPADLELGETVKAIFERISALRPGRVVIDSLSEIRLLAQSAFRYRRQVLALKHFLSREGVTVLLLDDMTADERDKALHSVAHGVVHLEQLTPDYGAERRRLCIVKYRGQPFRGGFHDFTIKTGGVIVFPRLVAAEHRTSYAREVLTSGNAELDALLGGGLERGSSTLVLGPSGTGKSMFGLEFVMAAVRRGERAAMFVFDEELGLLFARMRNLGIELQTLRERGQVHIEQVDAAELSPGEFSHRVRQAVETSGAATVLIDSVNGYQASMPQERALVLHMHELLQFLNRRGARTFLTAAQHGLVGEMKMPADVVYLADTVILLRFFEADGAVRRAVSVVKKRTGEHEPTMREFTIGTGGLRLGAPLTDFKGILGGAPTFVGAESLMLGSGSAGHS